MTKQITVLAAVSLEALEALGADVENTHMETIAEAKRRAQYLLTDEYHQTTEATEALGYARVTVDGRCVADYFRN